MDISLVLKINLNIIIFDKLTYIKLAVLIKI